MALGYCSGGSFKSSRPFPLEATKPPWQGPSRNSWVSRRCSGWRRRCSYVSPFDLANANVILRLVNFLIETKLGSRQSDESVFERPFMFFFLRDQEVSLSCRTSQYGVQPSIMQLVDVRVIIVMAMTFAQGLCL